MVMVAGVCAVAGSVLFAAPAFAGGVDGNGVYSAGVYNLTPYSWTLVEQNAPGRGSSPSGNCPVDTCWVAPPAQTIAPGGEMIYQLLAYEHDDRLFGQQFLFDGWMTYRVDVVGGAPEYVTIAVSGCQCSGTFGTGFPALRQFFTSAPPPASYDPRAAPDTPPGPLTVGPQLAFQEGVPQAFDLTYTVTGDYTVDASTDLGAQFVDLLNSVCGGDATACSFTQTAPLTWGIGSPGSPQQATNCAAPGVKPNYFTVEYEAAQSASLSVGGGVTVSAEASLFGLISTELSVSVDAEHEWEEVKTFTRETKVFIPPQDIASIWVVPVVGTVTGTLVLKVNNGSGSSAKFTATNFSETRSGVTKDPLTPAFNVITKVRPMTAGELQNHCHQGFGSLLGAPPVKPAARVVPGRGIPQVSLGQTQAQVRRQLGKPLVRRFVVNPCQGLEQGCDAVAGTGGRWSYDRLSVVFGPDLRVSGLIYSGTRLSAKGVGVGSGMTAVRVAYPDVSCARVNARRRYCTLSGTPGGGPVKTVFRFIKTRAGRYKCDRVVIYAIAAGSGEVAG